MTKQNFEIVFFAAYPAGTVNEGMAQRILQIDEKFHSQKRVYIDCSLKRFGPPVIRQMTEDLSTVSLNPLLHYERLKAYIDASRFIYFHSIYNYLHVAFVNLSNKKLILDVHGVVPEENSMEGRKVMSVLYAFLERRLFGKLSYAICVSEQMKKYLQKKYPFSSKNIDFLTLPIVQDRANNLVEVMIDEISNDDVVFVYSGGLQKWQNIPLMLETIRSLKAKNYLFLLLTQKPEELKHLIGSYNMNGHRIVIRSANKRELPYYYSLSHYGFLLRDDHVVNAVASPTKMFEYLEGGVTPILLSENIGDLDKLNIDKINVKDLNNFLSKKKSTNNQKQVELLRQKASVDLWSMLSSS